MAAPAHTNFRESSWWETNMQQIASGLIYWTILEAVKMFWLSLHMDGWASNIATYTRDSHPFWPCSLVDKKCTVNNLH